MRMQWIKKNFGIKVILIRKTYVKTVKFVTWHLTYFDSDGNVSL